MGPHTASRVLILPQPQQAVLTVARGHLCARVRGQAKVPPLPHMMTQNCLSLLAHMMMQICQSLTLHWAWNVLTTHLQAGATGGICEARLSSAGTGRSGMSPLPH